jgi:hypothetical protein
MKAYFEPREYLAALYAAPVEWRRVARDAGADVRNIVFEGSSLGAWSSAGIQGMARLPARAEVHYP